MLDPRIYRTGLVAVALAVVVLAFSLQNQQGALGTNLAPDAFNGQNAYSTMTGMASQCADRRPGSSCDYALASTVAQTLSADGFNVSKPTFTARTADGTRTLENVIATRPGTNIQAGSIVLVSHRDSLGSPLVADLSGTGVLLELARVLAGQTEKRTVVLASTSGSAGASGARELAHNLAGPVDAVIVLGNLAGTHIDQPTVVSWSNGQRVAPPMLRNTLAAALGAQTSVRAAAPSLASQIAHLAFPLTISEQGPFGVVGDPAVLVSTSGERAPAADAPYSQAQITATGRAVVQSVSALDSGPPVPAPSAYLVWSGKVIPDWAVRLFVLGLIAPVLLAMVDGIARARRRGHAIFQWVVWVLAAAVPFALAAALVLAARAVGLIDIAPPGAVGPGAIPMRGKGIALLVVLALVTVAAFVWLRPVLARIVRWQPGMRPGSVDAGGLGAGAGLLLVMSVLTLLIWVGDPYAAALMVPALHLWLWVVDPEIRVRPAVKAVLVVIGLVPAGLVALYYAVSLGLGPVQMAWNWTLLLAGGQLSPVRALEWSVALGCAASVIVIALKAPRQPREAEQPVTVRGPVTYAGPGSLGGTESALRR